MRFRSPGSKPNEGKLRRGDPHCSGQLRLDVTRLPSSVVLALFLCLPFLPNSQPSPSISSLDSQKREPNLVFTPSCGRPFHARWPDGPESQASSPGLPGSDLWAVTSLHAVGEIRHPGKPVLPLLVECSQLHVRQYPNTKNPATRSLFFSLNRKMEVLELSGSVTPEDQAVQIFPLCQAAGQYCCRSVKFP